MVGPDAEHTAQVRHFGRLFVTAASISVPLVTIVLRKGYGLGAMAMAGGGFHSNAMTVSWPTGEFGGMGLEGAVRLGFSKELAAIDDEQERNELEAKLIARAYEHGSALNMASHVEIDDVIDPAETRQRILSVIGSTRSWRARDGKKRPMVDAW
jgi:acetyl-CoA carboxylase carboxyltransferase component